MDAWYTRRKVFLSVQLIKSITQKVRKLGGGFWRISLLDIKPYVENFDRREGVKSGWLDKHFAKGETPDQTIIR